MSHLLDVLTFLFLALVGTGIWIYGAMTRDITTVGVGIAIWGIAYLFTMFGRDERT